MKINNKILTFLLVLCFSVPSVFLFSACSASGTKTYKITVVESNYGVIAPNFADTSNTIELNEGSNFTFHIEALPDYRIANLIIDGNIVPASSTYTFKNIANNHTISANFKSGEISDFKLEGIIIDLNKSANNVACELSIESLRISQYYGQNDRYKFLYPPIGYKDIIKSISSGVIGSNGKGTTTTYKFKEEDFANNVRFFDGVATLNIICEGKYKYSSATDSTCIVKLSTVGPRSASNLVAIKSNVYETLYSYKIDNPSTDGEYYIKSIELIFSEVISN